MKRTFEILLPGDEVTTTSESVLLQLAYELEEGKIEKSRIRAERQVFLGPYATEADVERKLAVIREAQTGGQGFGRRRELKAYARLNHDRSFSLYWCSYWII
ncbi:MAG: hypothetical protein FWC79_05110 [Oscillospiraceae bacterium]|nr:hypothetical protein [Oscillospiraceae bacterium]